MGQLAGATDPIADANWHTAHERKGFFTDSSICIGCKACEVACKEWNRNPQDGSLEMLGSSFDNTGGLGANTWRHVKFVEQGKDDIASARESGRKLVSLGMPQVRSAGSSPEARATLPAPSEDLSNVDILGGLAGQGDAAGAGAPTGADAQPDTPEFRWLMSSDVCKHCTHAGCLDVCPTGALFRTEFGTVVVQNDVCNGCGTCVAGCPFGVIERRDDGTVNTNPDREPLDQEVPNAGTANKCTLCYDRLVEGQTPACAQTCPTTSIKFGDHDSMVETAQERVAELRESGMTEARLYGANPNDGVGGTGSVFLLLDEPEVYGLPPDPRVPTADLPSMYKRAGVAALGMLAAATVAFLGGRK